jgi:NAD(P)-dependent dehydrogenase (short-subunit alcohol dehydrogenase family)
MSEGKVAIITAGGSGIGAGAARRLAADGFHVAYITGQNIRIDGGITRHV